MASGTPEDVSQCAQSYTGQFLRRYLQGDATEAYRLVRPHPASARGRRTTMPLPSVVRVNTT